MKLSYKKYWFLCYYSSNCYFKQATGIFLYTFIKENFNFLKDNMKYSIKAKILTKDSDCYNFQWKYVFKSIVLRKFQIEIQ